MNKHITAALATAGLLLIPYISFAQDCAKPFKEGDRIVWMGDSITHGGHYHSYVWLYYMTMSILMSGNVPGIWSSA